MSFRLQTVLAVCLNAELVIMIVFIFPHASDSDAIYSTIFIARQHTAADARY